jgi:cytochrome P450
VKNIPRKNGFPIVGNLPVYRTAKIRFLSELRDQLGDRSIFRLGKHPILLLTSPHDLQWVESKNAKNYVKATNLRELVGDGIFLSEGEKWRRQRRLIQPTFHQGAILKMVETMNRRIASTIDSIGIDVDQSLIEKVSIGDRVRRLAFEIMGEALFGADVGQHYQNLRPSLEYINSFLTKRFHQLIPISLEVPLPSHLRFRQAKKRVDETVQSIIEIKNRKIAAGTPDDDLLTRIILAKDPETGESMPKDQLRDEAVSLMIAGFETTGNLFQWLLHLLSVHPEVQSKLNQELQTVLGNQKPNAENVFQLRYLSDVVDETMRLYPPIWAWTKRAIGEDRLDDLNIESGTILFVSPYLLQRHPKWWNDPDRFDPSRWTTELREKNKFVFMPFGTGPRTCVGKHFALMELKLFISRFLQEFELEPVPGFQVEADFQVLLGMKKPLQITLKRRVK